MKPATYLILAVGAIVAACTYFETHRPRGPGPDNGIGGIACGFPVIAAAALLGAAHLHRKPRPTSRAAPARPRRCRTR